MLHTLANDGGYVALKRAAEDREGWRHREIKDMSKPAYSRRLLRGGCIGMRGRQSSDARSSASRTKLMIGVARDAREAVPLGGLTAVFGFSI